MLCLCLDASSKSVSAALAQEDLLLGETVIQNGLTHSQSLMPMLDELLRFAGKTMADVGLVAVCAGPGSFTGVRIAVATAMGLAGERPCVALNTLEVLAMQAEGSERVICPMLDARAGQVYAGAWRNDMPVLPCEAQKLDDFLRKLEALDRPCLFVGDGAAAYAERLNALPFGRVASPQMCAVHAAYGALAALKRPTEWTDAASLRPIYLRAPQAERQRLARAENGGIAHE